MDIHVPAFSRRRFLRTLGQGTLLAALPTPIWAAETGAVTISILHTTDLHGHVLPTTDYNGAADLGGLARCATQIRQWRAQNPNTLTLDVGDVYQGTAFGLQSRGETMVRCLDALNYDAWVAGNHDFDWGSQVFSDSVGVSTMPVLCANAMVGGKRIGKVDAQPLAKMRPYVLKEIAGFRIAVIGITTPALATWLPREDLGAFEPLDPAEILREVLAEVATHHPDEILLAGHMGLKHEDDYANRVTALTREFPQITVCLGGHTHQDYPGTLINQVLYTQADHYGIHAGKIDLTFNSATRKLVRRESATVKMDRQIALDPLVLSLARHDLDLSDQVLKRPMGELTEPFGVATSFGLPSDVERLIGSAIVAALQKKGVVIDAVMHGLFDTKNAVAPGPKTVADAWTILPYENQIVTVDLSRNDFLAMAREFGASRDVRNFMGVHVAARKEGRIFRIDDIRATNGSPLPSKPSYRIALNSYDSQSGGQRFPITGRLVAQAQNHRMFHPINIRDALIDFFVERGKVSRASLLV